MFIVCVFSVVLQSEDCYTGFYSDVFRALDNFQQEGK